MKTDSQGPLSNNTIETSQFIIETKLDLKLSTHPFFENLVLSFTHCKKIIHQSEFGCEIYRFVKFVD
jgi:hypothetical protein